MTTPDPDAHEVRDTVFGRSVDGAWHVATRTGKAMMDTRCGQTGARATEFFAGVTDTKARVWCITCVNALGDGRPPTVPVPRSLAQRILAALEGEAAFLHNEGKESGSRMLYVIASELRAVIGK